MSHLTVASVFGEPLGVGAVSLVDRLFGDRSFLPTDLPHIGVEIPRVVLTARATILALPALVPVLAALSSVRPSLCPQQPDDGTMADLAVLLKLLAGYEKGREATPVELLTWAPTVYVEEQAAALAAFLSRKGGVYEPSPDPGLGIDFVRALTGAPMAPRRHVAMRLAAAAAAAAVDVDADAADANADPNAPTPPNPAADARAASASAALAAGGPEGCVALNTEAAALSASCEELRLESASHSAPTAVSFDTAAEAPAGAGAGAVRREIGEARVPARAAPRAPSAEVVRALADVLVRVDVLTEPCINFVMVGLLAKDLRVLISAGVKSEDEAMSVLVRRLPSEVLADSRSLAALFREGFNDICESDIARLPADQIALFMSSLEDLREPNLPLAHGLCCVATLRAQAEAELKAIGGPIIGSSALEIPFLEQLRASITWNSVPALTRFPDLFLECLGSGDVVGDGQERGSTIQEALWHMMDREDRRGRDERGKRLLRASDLFASVPPIGEGFPDISLKMRLDLLRPQGLYDRLISFRGRSRALIPSRIFALTKAIRAAIAEHVRRIWTSADADQVDDVVATLANLPGSARASVIAALADNFKTKGPGFFISDFAKPIYKAARAALELEEEE